MTECTLYYCGSIATSYHCCPYLPRRPYCIIPLLCVGPVGLTFNDTLKMIAHSRQIWYELSSFISLLRSNLLMPGNIVTHTPSNIRRRRTDLFNSETWWYISGIAYYKKTSLTLFKLVYIERVSDNRIIISFWTSPLSVFQALKTKKCYIRKFWLNIETTLGTLFIPYALWQSVRMMRYCTK